MRVMDAHDMKMEDKTLRERREVEKLWWLLGITMEQDVEEKEHMMTCLYENSITTPSFYKPTKEYNYILIKKQIENVLYFYPWINDV